MRRTLIVARVVCVTLLVLALAGLATAWLAGWKLNAVETGSMAPEIPTGSLAVVAPVRPAAVEVGDVVTFGDPDGGDRVVLHRVIEVVGSAEGPMLRTQGDANATPDPELVPARSIEGRLRHAVPRLGTVVTTLQPPLGALLLVGLPTLVLLSSEARQLSRRPRVEIAATPMT